MHELTLCRNLISIILDEAARHKIQRIHRIILEIGKLVAIEKTALTYCFELVSKDTVAQNAILEVIEIEGKAYCYQCDKHTPILQYFSSCQFCDGFNLNIVAGKELKIKYMEVE